MDTLGNYEAAVTCTAVYALSPQAISREVSLFVGQKPEPSYSQAVSREVSILTPGSAVPVPVAGIDSGFTVEASRTEFGAVDMDWTSYNEWGQGDVVRLMTSAAGTLEIVTHDNAVNFVIEPKLGYGIRILTPKSFRLEGYCRCAPRTLVGGLNTVGYPGLIADATCYGWLQPMGTEYVSSIQHFNVESGGFVFILAVVGFSNLTWLLG